ncbi:MAG: N-formylglutamate amidohydrolase [Pseudomonadota bacterium]
MTAVNDKDEANVPEPVRIRRPRRQTLPLVISSPHSGRDYPSEFLALSRLDRLAIRRSEDAFVDELAAGAVAMGAPLVAATFPRAFLDPNREPYELDPRMFDSPLPGWVNSRSPRVRAGLGTVPRVVAGGAEIYAGKLEPGVAEERIKRYYMPYHDAIVALLDETRANFGIAVLLDCHSMPSGERGGPAAKSRADIVLGDRFGHACDAEIMRLAAETLRARGYQVRRNDPYPGGFITEHYGRPDMDVHALQIEMNRSLYMNEARMTRGSGMAALKADLEHLFGVIANQALLLAPPANAAE